MSLPASSPELWTIAALNPVWNDVARLPWGREIAARRMHSEGMVLMTALRISGKLDPMILGYVSNVTVTPLGSPAARGFDRRRARFWVLALALAASFSLEYLGSERARLASRAIGAGAAVVTTMPLWRQPQPRRVLVMVLRIAHWMMVFSPCAVASLPAYRLKLLHLRFIGGFGVLILVIGTRITLSHGNFSLVAEHRSKSLLASTLLLIVAVLVRATETFFPNPYVALLRVAGVAWLVGLVVWGAAFDTRAIWLHPAR